MEESVFEPQYTDLSIFDSTFESYDEMREQIDKWCDDNYVPIKTRTSNLLRPESEISQKLRYSSLYLTCVHYGKHRQRITKGTRVNQKVYATDCPFMIHVKANIDSEKLFVFNYELAHNHQIGAEIYCNYPKKRRLDEEEQQEVAKLLAVDPVHRKLKRHITMNTSKPITSYDINNLKAKLAKKQNNYIDDEGKRLKNLIEQIKNEDADNIVLFCLDDDNQLKCLFIQTKFQANWFKSYDTIIHIDGTFKLNIENYLLYVLLVQDSNCHGRPVAYCLMKNETIENLRFFYKSFVESNNVDFVKLVMVDKDLTNLDLIREFFPASMTLLCVFHVIKYLKSVVGKLVVSQNVKNEIMEHLKGMIYASNDQVYQEHYFEFKECAKKFKDFIDFFDNNWNNCQELWVRYHRSKLPTLGTHTNNHLESYNNNLKISIKPKQHLTDCLVELMLITKEFLQKDLQNKLNQIKTKVAKTCISQKVNELIAKLDDKATDLILDQFELMRKTKYTYKRYGESDFKVQSQENVYVVSVDEDNVVKCECDFTINFMLPCRHSLFVCESNVYLKPWYHERFSKSSLSFVNPLAESQSICSSKRPLWQWTKDCLRPSTPEQKYRKLKNLFEDITNVMCTAGEQEFIDQENKLKKFLSVIQTNTQREEVASSSLNQSTPRSSIVDNNKYMLNDSTISNISSCRRDLLNEFNGSNNNDSDTELSLTQQSEFDMSPQIKINRVVNRVGRPKNSCKKFGFFNVNKPKRVLESENKGTLSPVSKRTRSKK